MKKTVLLIALFFLASNILKAQVQAYENGYNAGFISGYAYVDDLVQQHPLNMELQITLETLKVRCQGVLVP
jgi:hypothetical protein